MCRFGSISCLYLTYKYFLFIHEKTSLSYRCIANHITVLGLSKGGYIAQVISTLLASPEVNFVFIGSFKEQDLVNMPEINFCGNILNLYDKSDEFNVSAIKRKETSKLKVTRFKELELNTNLKHGFLFRPLPEWVIPVINWGTRRYGSV